MSKRLLLALLLLTSSAFATTTVSGNIKDLTGTAVSSNTFVRFYLRGCSGNQPRINGTALIAPTFGNVYYKDFVPNSSGVISGTLYSTRDAAGTGNGEIECGGVFTGVWYGMVAFQNGKAGPETPVHAKNGVTLDISNVTALSTNPVITAPAGDTTYLRLDGTNSPATGAITFNGTTTFAGAITDAVGQLIGFQRNGAPPNLVDVGISHCTANSTLCIGNGTAADGSGSLTAGAGTFSGALTSKLDQGVPHCKDYATAGVTPFQTMMANCVAALSATGPGTVDARDVTDTTNLTMTGNWTMSRSGTTVLFGAYTVNQGTNSIIIPSPTSNIKFLGSTAFATTPAGAVNGTYFKYTGTGSAHQFGDSSAQSFGHDIEDIACDLTGASGSAHCFDSTMVYGAIFRRVRGLCPVAANTMTFIQNKGTIVPGSQSMTVDQVVENNCQTGFLNTGLTSPPGCNNVVFNSPSQFSGNSATGSIGVDIECGNDIEVSGIYMNGYDHGLKIATPSTAAVRGFFHAESCGTDGISFTAGTAGNWIWTDTACAITDAVGATSTNTVIGSPNGAHTVYFGGSPLQLISLGNFSDNALNMNLQAGTTADQQVNLNFKDKSNATQYVLQKDTANDFKLQDAAGINRFWANGNNIFINSKSTAAVNINGQSNASTGTGGLAVFSGGASSASVWAVDGTGQVTKFKGASTPLARVTTDFTTASATLVTITGLSWTVPATAQNFSFHCSLDYSQATAAVANSFGIQAATNSPTNIRASGIVYTAAGTSTSGTLSTLATTTATNIVTFTPSATATVFTAVIDGTIENPASANTFNIMVLTGNASDSITVKRGSYCQLF